MRLIRHHLGGRYGVDGIGLVRNDSPGPHLDLLLWIGTMHLDKSECKILTGEFERPVPDMHLDYNLTIGIN